MDQLFQPEELGNGRVAFRTAHGRYLSARPGDDGWILRQTEWRQGWEEFTIHDTNLVAATTRVSQELERVVIPGFVDARVVWEGLNSHIEHREKFRILKVTVNVPSEDVMKWIAFLGCVAASTEITLLLVSVPITWLEVVEAIVASAGVCYGAINQNDVEHADGEAEVIEAWGDWHPI